MYIYVFNFDEKRFFYLVNFKNKKRRKEKKKKRKKKNKKNKIKASCNKRR